MRRHGLRSTDSSSQLLVGLGRRELGLRTGRDAARKPRSYAAREHDTLGMDGATLARRITHPNVQAVGDIGQAAATLGRLLQPGDVVLTLGAGDGYLVGEQLLDALGAAELG